MKDKIERTIGGRRVIPGIFLRPCPFCGSEAVVSANDDMYGSAQWKFYVGCMGCDCEKTSGWTYDYDNGHSEAVIEWNSRVCPWMTRVSSDEERDMAKARLDEIDSLRRCTSSEREEYDRIQAIIDDYDFN